MMEIGLGIALVVCGYLAFRLFCLKRGLSRAERELREISVELKENRVVKLDAPEKGMEKLADAINENLEAIRRERLSYQKKERWLKEQVENISHDLRTPLTGLLGYLKMMDREALEKEEREFLDTAVRKGKTLEKRISQFYALSRVTADEFQLKLEKTDVGRCLRECALEHYGQFERSGLTFSADIPKKAVMEMANLDALERIFTNLLQNAVRYAKTGLWVSLTEGKDGAGAVIVFQNDIAPGMKLEDANRLFDRFYIQEESRARGGTGLGLTISQHLAGHMNARLEASYSQEGEKLCLNFILTFPGKRLR